MMKNIVKIIFLTILTSAILFLGLEIIQRVRWYFKSGKSPYWLLYGFVSKPTDFDEQIARIAERKKAVNKTAGRTGDIQIYEKRFPNGIKKHNPDYPPHKGQVNSLGFRSDEFSPQKPPGVYRIVALGSSTTAGYESDVHHTFPALLQKKLNDQTKGPKRFEVINAGKGEVDMRYVNGLLETELVKYDPDMAIAYLTFVHLHLRRGTLNFVPDFNYKMYRVKQWLSSRSLLFLTFREKLNIMFRLEGKILGDIYIPTANPRSLAAAFLNTPDVFTSYRNDLTRFVGICKAHGIKPVLVTEITILSNDYYLLLNKEMDAVYKKMYGVMQDVAEKEGAVYINADESIRTIPGYERLFFDGSHASSEGNNALADIICDRLKKEIEKE